MARGTRTVYPGKRNKGLRSTFQLPKEDGSIQWLKRCDKHGNKDEDNNPKNVNNRHNTSSQKYRQIQRNDIFDNFIYGLFLKVVLVFLHLILLQINES